MLSALQSSRRPDSSESASLGPSSTLGNVSHGFRSRFEMLFYPENSPLSDQGFHTKQEDIRACLRGKVDESTGNEMVNLWQLRELSLSKGGLLSADLRKRAWPTLLACHEQVFPELAQQDDYVAPRRVQPDPGNIRSLQHDVSQTIWNVQDCLVASRQHRQIQNEKMDRFLEEQCQQSQKKVTFAPSLVQASPKPHTPAPKAPETPPVVIATSSAASGARVRQDDTTSVLSHDDSATGLFDDSSWSVRTHETAFTLSSRVIRWRKASSQEQKILYNVISSVLQTGPPIHGNDEVYFHYNGLQDLTALLLINLESPSLTSIVLEKLARWHLRDALRPDRSHIEIVLECCFMPLLESVDSGLYNHLVNKGLTLPSFATQWIACWFAQDIPDAPMASRFLDAFIVGHALLPLYVAVAFVASHREWIWSECENLSSLYATLRGIPFRALTHGLDLQHEEDVQQGMMRVEKILETALLYMKRLPPSDLLEISRNRVVSGEVLEQISTITMFGPENVPIFVTGPHSPTDYAVLQQAKWFRTKLSEPIFSLKQTGGAKNEELPGLAGSPTLEEEDEPEGSHIPSPESYTLTCVALGISNVTSSTRSRRALGSLWMLLFVGVLFAYLAVVLPPQFHLFGTQSTAVPLHLSRGSEPDSRRASDLTNPKLQGTLGLSQLKFTFQGFATSVVTENVLMEGDYSDMIKENRALPSLSSVFKINWFAVFRQQFHLLQAVWRDLLSPFRHRKASAESSKDDLTASG